MIAAVVERPSGVLLFRRPDHSELLAGTWELPWVEETEGDPAAALAARYGGGWHLGPQVAEVKHGITFRDLTVAVHRAELAAGKWEVRDGPAAGWFDAAGRAGLPLSSLVGKVLKKLPAREEVSSPSSISLSTPSDVASAGPPARRFRSRRRG